jgi:DNA primase
VDPTRLVNVDKLKDEIEQHLSISDVAERLCDVELVPSGKQKKGLCPIHGENTPSFFVSDSKGLFTCWGCKAGGDSITLVREVHHVGFRDALVLLAGEAGIDIAAYERAATPEERAQDQLRAWCEAWLHGLKPERSRVKDPVILQDFGIVVPEKPKGQVPESLRETDYLFRGTVLFPYRTAAGKLVGWKTRAKDKAMFATPAEFPLTQVVVYGMDVARPHIEHGKAIVVEGEYDTAAMHEHGLRHTVGIGGSRWTEEQMHILEEQRVRDVIFFMDGDEPGRGAAESIAKRYWRHPTMRVRIAQAWDGADPEDMLRTMGEDLVRAHLDEAKGALEWLLWQKWSEESRSTLSAKMDFVRWIQDEYGDQLMGVQETLVLREVANWLGLSDADVLDFARADKTVLQAPDSEKVVLGRCVRDANYYMDVRKRVNKDDLYVLRHQRVWATLEKMLADGLSFDLATIRSRAENEGVEPAYVDVLAETGELNIGWHEEQVIDLSVRRGARADADYFRDVIADTSVPANQLIGTLTHKVTSKALGRGSGASRAMHEQVDEAMDLLHTRMRNPDEVHGINLGSQFPQFTRTLQGLQPRRLVTVAATSGKGKSTIVIQWFAGLAVQQAIPCDFISLEMDESEILFKAASHLTGIDSMDISGGRLNPAEAKQVEQAMARLRNSPLRIYAPDGISAGEMLLYAREAVMERRTELFALDFIQQIGPEPDNKTQSRYQQLGDAAYLMKQKICRGLDVGVVCIAQLKRDAAEEPTPEDMGDSYEIVRASDVVVLLNETSDQAHEIWVGKNRQGPGGIVVPARFDKPMNTWRESSSPKLPDYAII